MKRILTYILLGLLSVLPAMAQTPSGLSCADAIPVDSGFSFEIPGPGTYWFTAWTYDLPLGVHFSPAADGSAQKPVASIDFTCEMGVYEDSLLRSVLHDASGWGIEVPIIFNFDLSVASGRNEYDLSIGKTYRESLARFGVTYNVQAYVMVEFPEAGTISMTPDSLFHDCMDHAHYMHIPDTFHIQPFDSATVYVLPYSDWQDDSIMFEWRGAEPARIWVAAEGCGFTPDLSDDYVWDYFDLPAGGSYKLDNQTIRQTIKTHDAGGLFYAKVIASEQDTLIVHQVPPQDVEGDAVALRYGRSVNLAEHDTTSVFYFLAGWDATEFSSVTTAPFTMYWSNTAFFTPQTAKGAVRFGKEGSYYKRFLSTKEMRDIEQRCGDYVYVRFDGDASAVLTPYAWDAGECADRTAQITLDEQFTVASTSTAEGATVYRLRYSDFERGNLIVTSALTTTLPVYIADTCVFSTSSSDPALLQTLSVPRRSSVTVSDSAVATWADRVDADGFLYVTFSSSRSGKVVFSTVLPEPEPIPLAMIELHLDSTVMVNAHDTAQYYYFSRTWDTFSVFLTADVSSPIMAYFGHHPGFMISEEDPYYLGSKPFSQNGSQMEMSLSRKDLLNMTSRSASDQIFVRFWCAEPSSITPTEWAATPCSDNSSEILLGDSVYIPANHATELYRIDYADWAAQEVSLVWRGPQPIDVYLSHACTYNASANNVYVLRYQRLAVGDTMRITPAQMQSRINRLNVDGFFYLRFSCSVDDYLLAFRTGDKIDDRPTALPVALAESTLQVRYVGNDVEVTVSEEQDIRIYDVLGRLLASWHQFPGVPRRIDIPAAVLILRGKTDTQRILR